MNARKIMKDFRSGKVLPCAGCVKQATALWKSVNVLEPICNDCSYQRLAIQNIVRIMETAGVQAV